MKRIVRIEESEREVNDPLAYNPIEPDYGDWGRDPAEVLADTEEELGINCFGQPIH